MYKGFFSILLVLVLCFTSCKVAEKGEKNNASVNTTLPTPVLNKSDMAGQASASINQAGPKAEPFGGKCVNANAAMPNRRCPKSISYVCGCNNITYDNQCMADKAGVLKTKRGKCKTSVKGKTKTAVR